MMDPLVSGNHYCVPVHLGPTAVVHGLPDPPGTYPEEKTLWPLSADTE